MTEVNVAELRRALARPPGKLWFIPEFGLPHESEMDMGIVVDRPILAALLDAYERDQEANPIPASYLRIIESVLARVLAGEPAAQVVADYPDEHGHTIEGLERVERLLKAVAVAVEMRPQSLSLITAYHAIKEAPADG